MNKVVLLALSLVSTLAFATPVPQNQLKSYKDAFGEAESNSAFSCKVTSGSDDISIPVIVDQAMSAEVDASGGQPALTFTALSADSSFKSVVEVTTSADFKSIVSISGATYVLGNINLGTLVKPEIVSGYILRSSLVCKAIH